MACKPIQNKIWVFYDFYDKFLLRSGLHIQAESSILMRTKQTVRRIRRNQMIHDKMDSLTALTEKALTAARAGQRLLTAVSGGADSVCLLLCASALREKGYRVSAAHVRHDLRDTARRDELFVQDLCARLDIPFYSAAVHVPKTGSTEEQARLKRYEALARICRQTHADVLLLAHHQNDQAETVLMRLIRGCGSEGLAGIRSRSAYGDMILLRPFLSVSADFIRSALREAGQTWCEDETNRDTRFTRNFLRHQILSPLENAFPGSVRGLCRSADILAADNDLLNRLTEDALAEAGCLTPPCRFLILDQLKPLHPALQRRLIRRFLTVCGAEPGFEKTEEIRMSLSHPPARLNLPHGSALVFSPERVHFVPAVPEKWEIPDDFFMTGPPGETGDGKTCQAFPNSLLSECSIRLPQPGDMFQPFGHGKEVRLSRFLIEKKIDRPFRPFLPLICLKNVVLWIPGTAASERLRLQPGEPSVTLTVRGRLPWEHPMQVNQQEEKHHGTHCAHL